jgi:Type I phosphodiesterase / nucleotide pyrophosphatase
MPALALPTADDLIAACREPAWGGMLPHPSYSLCAMRGLLEDAFNSSSPTFPLSSQESVVVIVADGVSSAVAQACWSPSRHGALTSTCPSTTSTALLSATTGRAPSDHGVVGVAFFDSKAGAVFDCYADGPAPPDFSLGTWPTVFSALSERVDCVAHLNALATIPGRWSNAVVHGAEIIPPAADWNLIGNDPAAMVDAVTAAIDSTLARRRARPLLLWAHLNLDSAIHLRGYDEAVCEALRTLGRNAKRWAGAGHTVVVHSDHGLVEIRGSGRAARLLGLLRDPNCCRATSGGAGRMIWAYPRSGSSLFERASELARGFAEVIRRDDLFASGIMADTTATRERIGEVVVIATGEEFALLAPDYKFEHGAMSRTEMIAPVALWTENRTMVRRHVDGR